MKRPIATRRRRNISIVSTVIATAVLLALLTGCPATDLKQYLTLATGFEGHIYVSIETGNDVNRGTAAEPLATIREAIVLGQWYQAQGVSETINVYVAEGTYEQDSSQGIGIYMVEGISLYGGYSTDFEGPNSEEHETIIVDTATTGEAGDDGRAAVWAIGTENAITRATVIDGFTIVGGTAESGWKIRAMAVESASPTIRNNTIDAGPGRFALDIFTDADPVVYANTIMGSTTNPESFRVALLMAEDCLAHVTNNVITGGGDGLDDNPITVAFWDTGVELFENNTITGGDGESSFAVQIADDSNVGIVNCTITAGTALGENEDATGIFVVGATATIEDSDIIAPRGILVEADNEGDGSFANIRFNEITSVPHAEGSTGWARGVVVNAGCRALVSWNTITAGPAPDGVRGVEITSPSGEIMVEANTITCEATTDFMGIRVSDCSQHVVVYDNTVLCRDSDYGTILSLENLDDAHVFNNTLLGQNNVWRVMGLNFHESSGGIENNVINPGTVVYDEFEPDRGTDGILVHGTSTAVYDDQGTWLLNNTICGGGDDGATWAVGLAIQDSSPWVNNNIFFTSKTVVGTSAISEQTEYAHVSSLRHNLFYRYASSDMVLYGDMKEDGDLIGSHMDIATIEDASVNGEGPGRELHVDGEDSVVFGNRVADPNIAFSEDEENVFSSADDVIFLDIDGPDDNFYTVSDNDWHLSADTTTLISEGGWTNPWAWEPTDLEYTDRTDPWSIGAYEYDAP